MRAEILVVGQGLAGTWLAWECERTGISFEIADRGDADGSTAVAAGMVNPITGRRFVKSWRVDTLLPAARVAYREFDAALGVRLWHEMRVRRLFADEEERRIFAGKKPGALEPFVGASDDEGFWIEGAARVDLSAMRKAASDRWRAQGRWREGWVDVEEEAANYERVIDCSGFVGARSKRWEFLPWEFSLGEALQIAIDGLDPGVAFNRGHWLVPLDKGTAWVGATHVPGAMTRATVGGGQERLEASARTLTSRPFRLRSLCGGMRVSLPDRRPVAGMHPDDARMGVSNGLGGKGALWAPMLARQWINFLVRGVPFDAETSPGRFERGQAAAASSQE
ncbi:MAG: FAD-dependent oxidoreductase [Opitutaceae bacterium]